MSDDTEMTTSAAHPRRVALPLLVAPSTDARHNAFRPELEPVACFLIGSAGFDFGSSFLNPALREHTGKLARLLDSHRGHPITLFGHADPTGTDESNKHLSGRRVRSVYGFL